MSEVKYMGYIISYEGLKPDSKKIEAIINMPRPKSVVEVQRFLGLITYLSKFVPNLAEKTKNIRTLLKKNVIFSWENNHEAEFEKLKEVITKEPCPKFLDEKEHCTLSVDSSSEGMGAVLLQQGKPCAYHSRSLNETQKGYAQIERELLAILFGCEKFYQYIFAKAFTVETDHKPLVSIIKKPLQSCPARLQRMLLQLKKFDFNLVYKPGKKLVIADLLSRAAENKEFDENIDIELGAQICLVEMRLNVTVDKLKQI